MILIVLAGALMLLVAVTGLAVDCCRILITRGASQGRMDAAALSAVLELDGTRNGIDRARQEATVAAADFGDNLKIEFSSEATGRWEENPRAPEQQRMVRVSTLVRVPLTLLRTVVRRDASEFGVAATATQQTQPSVPRDMFPGPESLAERFAEDPDFASRSYAEYASRGRGNGRRIVPQPEGAVFVLPAGGSVSGDAFAKSMPIHTTEPIGAYLQGSRWKGVGDSGYSVAVLVQ